MEQTEDPKIMRKLFIRHLILQKTEEISKQRDIIKKQYEDANELMARLDKKAEELKTVAFFFKNLLETDEPNTENN